MVELLLGADSKAITAAAADKARRYVPTRFFRPRCRRAMADAGPLRAALHRTASCLCTTPLRRMHWVHRWEW